MRLCITMYRSMCQIAGGSRSRGTETPDPEFENDGQPTSAAVRGPRRLYTCANHTVDVHHPTALYARALLY